MLLPVLCAPDERDLLLRFCVWPRLRHLLRTVTPGLCFDTFHSFDRAVACARLAVVPSDSAPTHIEPTLLMQLPGRFGGHGVMPHVSDPLGLAASYHDAAFYGSFAAVWHYMRTWIPALHGRQLAHRGQGTGLPYQVAVGDAFARVMAARLAVTLTPQYDSLLPSDARLPDVHTRLDDGRLSPATLPLGQGVAATPFDDTSDTPDRLYDLDCLDTACHPHAQRAASAVVASHAFMTLYRSATTTSTGRARMMDASAGRGPFGFWRRVPDVDPSLPETPLFAFPDPHAFPTALAIDLLLRPPVPGDPDQTHVACTICPDSHPVLPGDRHFVPCMHGIRLHSVCHDPAVRALVPFLDAVLGPARVIAERGGVGGRRAMDAWMQGPGAGLRHAPDIVLVDFDGERSYTLIDMKTLDAAGASHVSSHHTDRLRLSAHRAISAHTHAAEYGPLPARMRLVVLAVSTFGAIGPGGQTFIAELGRRAGESVPPSLLHHASWATPRLAPMVRMALGHAVRRGLAASVRTHWRRSAPPHVGADGALVVRMVAAAS